MKYVVKFGAKDGQRFSLLYQAFVMGGNNCKAPKDIEKLRREIAVMDLLWEISYVPEGADPRAASRVMHEGAHTVTLDRPQYELVKLYLDAFVGITATSSARDVVGMVDWFEKIEPTEGPTAKPTKKGPKAA